MQLFDQVWSREEALGASCLPVMSLRVFSLQSQDCIEMHRIYFMFSWDTVLKSNRVHGLFRALHNYLCLVR